MAPAVGALLARELGRRRAGSKTGRGVRDLARQIWFVSVDPTELPEHD